MKWNGDPEKVDELWVSFYNKMKEGVRQFIPKKLIKNGKKKRSCPSTPGILHKVRMKRAAYKQYKKYRTTNNWNIYCKYRNQVKWETRKSIRLKEKSIAQKVKTNPKFYFSTSMFQVK